MEKCNIEVVVVVTWKPASLKCFIMIIIVIIIMVIIQLLAPEVRMCDSCV